MSVLGHEERFPSLWPNVCCVIRHGTFAETKCNGQDASIPVIGLSLIDQSNKSDP